MVSAFTVSLQQVDVAFAFDRVTKTVEGMAGC